MIVVRAPPKNSDLFMQNFTTLQALFESSIHWWIWRMVSPAVNEREKGLFEDDSVRDVL